MGIIIYRSIVKSPIALLQTLCNDIIWFENITNTFGNLKKKKSGYDQMSIECK